MSSSKEVTINVNKATIDISQVKWDYETPFTYDGEVKEVKLVNLPSLVTATYTENSGTNANNYIAKAVLSYDSNNYELTNNNVRDLDWIINKKKVTIPSAKTNLVYNGNTLIGVSEDSLYTVVNGSGINANKYKAIVTLKDALNYEWKDSSFNGEIDWLINKGTIDMSQVKWDYETPFTYDGEVKEVKLVNLPSLVTATYTGNSGTNANDYIASVELIYDENNYKLSNTIANLNWRIGKEVIDLSNVKWDYDNSFTYDGKSKTVSLINIPNGVSVSYSGNSGVDAFNYFASATLSCDDTNYELSKYYYSLDWCIYKADIKDVSIRTYNGIYDGKEHNALISYEAKSYGDNDVVWSFSKEKNGTYSKDIPTFKDAGEYIVYYKIEANNHYIKTNSFKVKISKVKVEVPSAKTNLVYDGNTLIGIKEDSLYSVEGGSGINAGEYKAILKLKDSSNYEWKDSSFNGEIKWKIKKAQSIIDVSDIVTNYVYNGREQVIDKGATLNHSEKELVYSNNKFTTVKEGNNLVVVIRVGESENYSSAKETVKIKVSKAQYDLSNIVFNDMSFVYDGKEKSINVTGDLPEGVSVSYTGNNKKNVGEYQVTATFSGDWDNYERIPNITALMTINKEELVGKINGKEIIIIEISGGISKDVILEISEKEDIPQELVEKFKKDNQKVYEAYTISLKENDEVVIEEGMMVKVIIPDEVMNKNFQIFSNVNGDDISIKYEIEDGYAIFNASEISDIYIVSSINNGCSCNSAKLLCYLISALSILFVLRKKRLI